MIFDTLDNLNYYFGVNPKFKIVSDFLKSGKVDKLENGRHEITDGVFVLVMEYDLKTESEGLWEAHRKNFDIQLISHGKERVAYAEIKTMTATNEYTDDYQLFAGETQNYLDLYPGVFLLLAPQDVHKTSLFPDSSNTPQKIRKIVFKVPVKD